MNPKLRSVDHHEHTAASAIARGEFGVVPAPPKRGHITSQRFASVDVWMRLRMLALGWHRHDLRKVIGQMFRIVATLTRSTTWVPGDNIGGGPIPADTNAAGPASLPGLSHVADR